MTYTILIPVYNEYLALPSLLNKLKKLNLNENIETIIIDDGSYDGTKDLLHDKGFYELITYKTNLGKGAALKVALDKVKTKNIDQSKQNLVLELMAIDYLKNQNNYEINLIFNNNSVITLITEAIEVRLEDQSEIK